MTFNTVHNKAANDFFCKVQPYFNVDDEPIVPVFGISEAMIKTQKIKSLIDTLQGIIKDYDFKNIQDNLIIIEAKLTKIDTWSSNLILRGVLLEVNNDDADNIPVESSRNGFSFKIEGIDLIERVSGIISKPGYKDSKGKKYIPTRVHVLKGLNEQELFLVGTKKYIARFVEILVIESDYDTPVKPVQNSLKKGKVIIEIKEVDNIIGCNNVH